VDNGKVELFTGDMEDYQQWLLDRAKAEVPISAAKSTKPPLPQNEKRDLEKKVKSLELKIEKINENIAQLDLKLQDPALYEAKDSVEKINTFTQDKLKQQKELDILQDEWCLVMETLENAQ
jgi:ATP-binding cassette subfamily F protein 3